MTTPLWRSEIETRQVYGRVATFTRTLSADTAQNVVTLAGYMAEGQKVSLFVELNDVYINFDADAVNAAGSDGIIRSILIPAGTGYTEIGINFATRISAINATAGANSRLRGIIWGR